MPFKEICEQFVAFGHLLLRQIASFANVVLQIVEFNGIVVCQFLTTSVELPLFVIQVQLSVAFADDADRS